MDIQSPLLTDFYQLTMAYGYWRLGMAERESVFHLFFRRNPFQGNYTIHCGLDSVIEYLQNWRFSSAELTYLHSLRDARAQPLFSEDFLIYLADLRFSADLYAMPEGQIAFPHEPLLRVQGPILQCQLLETALLNFTSFASLVATKASRICIAAQGDPVLEFGLRRAQGPDGGMTASRAAYIGGCESVSNTLAAMRYQIPPRGTMAHSWVMAFADELTAFENFVEVMAGNTVLLVDTYDTVQGVRHAITVGQRLRAKGGELLGIRLDSGDLHALSCAARDLLDAAGFTATRIVASGDLDESRIVELKQRQAPIDIWGVGTRLTTAWDQPALDTAYKLAAIRGENGEWQYKLKRSDHPGKTTYPGIQQVRRQLAGERWVGDIIYDLQLGCSAPSPPDSDRQVDLLQPVFRQGQFVGQRPGLPEIQAFCRRQCQAFADYTGKEYPVQFESRLQAARTDLLKKYEEGR